MKKRGRGRPKGSKKRCAGIPHNYGYWYWIIKTPEQLKAFKKRGNERQKNELREAIIYYNRTNEEKIKCDI